MQKIYINKSFLASGFAVFLEKDAARRDESSDSPYVDSKEYEISDEDYQKIKDSFQTRESILDILGKYKEIQLWIT